jgi:hypothetical protein
VFISELRLWREMVGGEVERDSQWVLAHAVGGCTEEGVSEMSG